MSSVDCVDEQPGTWLADLNGEFTLPDRPFNVITCIGVVSHLNHEEAFFERLVVLSAGTFLYSLQAGPENQWIMLNSSQIIRSL